MEDEKPVWMEEWRIDWPEGGGPMEPCEDCVAGIRSNAPDMGGHAPDVCS